MQVYVIVVVLDCVKVEEQLETVHLMGCGTWPVASSCKALEWMLVYVSNVGELFLSRMGDPVVVYGHQRSLHKKR